ncbi:MAG: RNA-binding transcriptional accessory protein [Nitrospirae bacterium]|uniref:Tex family protein n=1 Tax=Candidatus Magnetobacterium casense TaxID=1455061 RepID=UPI00058BCD91|nr:Tex family protein [Candidatus Magnetobacterium casensis]MBF0337975.1 RNA-binding transcriptional accessory protein [Nitrospirota bacterium]
MNNEHVLKISQELSVREWQVAATVALLEEGATVPFVARYRKEATGSLDEVAITAVRDRTQQLMELDKRREAVLKSLQERGKLTDELKESILKAETMAVLEDIYLPYRPKRRTRATIAREKGLEPLATLIFAQEGADPHTEALAYIDVDKGVKDVADALAGARDIIAEWVNEDQAGRAKMRELFELKGTFRSKALSDNEDEGLKYKDYFDWEEPVVSAPSHRVLALRRGEKEGFLSLRTTPPEEEALETLMLLFVKGDNADSQQVRLAIHDSYKRLLSVSMETEIRLATKKRADEEAIKVFAENLRQLLLAPPLGQKTVLAIDPGFRTGCKVVCMDRQGKLLHNDTIYPTQSEKLLTEAANKIRALCRQYEINAIAIGNGTASRETEAFVRGLALPESIQVVLVNESGASVYSASEVAREEFPDHDVTVRGAVSIGRRLMDPLAELVKIDPKSIGVGQYQHDVDQAALRRSLDDVVISCVNAVGVEVNTASKQLLTYVSGLGPQLAARIVEYRQSNGPFRCREELKKVSKLGPKAFEQAAGFLRIREAENPLDASAVHPESYKIVYAIADDLKCSVSDLIHNTDISKLVDIRKYVTDTVGVPTLTDILEELAKPGRDPRQQFEAIRFLDDVKAIEDVKPGMKLPGIITNITAFGVFVDIGVHQDGLVHISQLADRFVKNPTDVVKVHQKVSVTVLEVDVKRKRISLSMKKQKG